MARHPILKMGDPRLLTVAKPVTAFDTPELHQLIADLRETMAGANGAGLAAPQIGVDRRLFCLARALSIRAIPMRPSFRRLY